MAGMAQMFSEVLLTLHINRKQHRLNRCCNTVKTWN